METKLNKIAVSAEERRLKSIDAKKKEYKNHRYAIKAALANVDAISNKKVIFDDEDLTAINENETRKTTNGNASKKRSLFEESDDDSEAEYNFEIKEQFEGKKGKKLMELQSKYKNDKRFLLDERFLDDENEEIESQANDDTEGFKGNEIEEEKQTEMAILKEILGEKAQKNSDIKTKKRIDLKVMLRHDPSNPEHANQEIKVVTDPKPTKKRKRKDIEKVDEDEELPQVSKETFYEVKQNFKDTMQENQSFSLLDKFGQNYEENDQIKDLAVTNDNKLNNKNKIHDENPFQFDSSEDEDVGKNEEKMLSEANDKKVNLGPKKLWTEPFFFRTDDYRFQDGFDFIRRFEVEDGDFSRTRRNIKVIVRAKVMHNRKKDRPFKRKLGGKKMIKIKKAMKR